jgi:hypothetical protein
MANKSITASEYRKGHPLSALAQMAELFARMSVDSETYSVESRARLAAVVDRIHRRRVARLDVTASW